MMESSLQSDLGFADDSLMLHEVSSNVFDSSVELENITGRMELTNSLSDATEWTSSLGTRAQLDAFFNISGRRFEKGIGLGQISEGLIEIKPICNNELLIADAVVRHVYTSKDISKE